MLAAAKAEEAIVELLRATPGMRTSAIAKAAGAPATTAQNRLLRLQRAGRIERGETTAGGRQACPTDCAGDRRASRAGNPDPACAVDQLDLDLRRAWRWLFRRALRLKALALSIRRA